MENGMKQKSRPLLAIILCVVTILLVMAAVELLIKPGYLVKSLIKTLLFLLIPALYCYIAREALIKNVFCTGKGGLLPSILLGIAVYGVIVGAYFILGPYFDLSGITRALTENAGVTKENFIYVSLYISFINSLLEEFFFRGFSFLILKKHTTRKGAHLFSAGAFALYHVAIMAEWVSIPLTALLIAVLFAGGILFNLLNERFENIYASWMVHMFANFAINTIGMILFGIL